MAHPDYWTNVDGMPGFVKCLECPYTIQAASKEAQVACCYCP